MSKAVFLCCNESNIHRVYGGGAYQKLYALTDVYHTVITSAGMLEEHLSFLENVEVIFSTWGMLSLDEKIIKKLPSLKAVFYAAGSVKGFAQPFLNCGVKVISAWKANGLPVAEFTLGHILLACCGYFPNICDYQVRKLEKGVFQGGGSYREKVGIIGAGCIGRRVIELLQPFDLELLLYDPYLAAADAAALGAEQADLNRLFKECIVVSNHLPLTGETRGMIGEAHFAMMRDHATFINTGRGATVDEDAMIKVLECRPSVRAVLDVTIKEPPEEHSPLYQLSNVLLSSHIAGSKGNELFRMADYCLDEFKRFQQGEPLQYEVTESMLENMA